MQQPTLFTDTPTAPAKTARPRRKRQPKPVVDNTATIEYGHTINDAGQRVWTLRFPAPAPMISVNGNPHWRKTSPARKAFREAMFLHAKGAKLPTGLVLVRVEVELGFPAGGRRDASNYYSHVVKPLVDGIGPPIDTIRGKKRVTAVGYNLIPDDTQEFLDGPYARLGPSGKRRGAPFGESVVTITDLSGATA